MNNDDFNDFNIELGDVDNEFFDDANDLEIDDNENDPLASTGNNDNFMENNGGYNMGNYNPQDFSQSEDSDDDNLKKRAIIIGCAGVALILLVVLIAGILLKSKNKSNNDPGVGKEVQIQQGNTYRNDNSLVSNSNSGWTEIDADKGLKFSDKISSTFTTTKVKHYVKTTTVGEMEIKSVVTGSIAGLTGTYELELPYSNAVNLNSGDYFAIQYKVSEVNGKVIISDISY